MKKTILIVRSVSFQQLDTNLIAIVERFAAQAHSFQLLTHSHGIARAESYNALKEVIDYNSHKNFSFFYLPRRLKKKVMTQRQESCEAIIVPVTNISGAGFLNVLAMTLRIRTKKVYICNLVSEIREVSKVVIVTQLVTAGLYSLLAAVFTIPLAVVALPGLLIGLRLRRKK